MATSYTFDSKGYFVCVIEDYGYPPNNSTRELLPPPAENVWPRWDGSAWNNAPSFKGQHGWLNGEPFTIKEHGPLPEGFSLECPAPTREQLFESLRSQRNQRLAETDYLLLQDSGLDAGAMSQVKAYRQSLRDLPAQPGAPWDGGGELTPWPEQP